jgi:hypothetical protein
MLIDSMLCKGGLYKLDESWLDESWLDESWLDESWLDESWLDQIWMDQIWMDRYAGVAVCRFVAGEVQPLSYGSGVGWLPSLAIAG